MHSQENCWQAPNGRYGQTPMVEHPRSPPPLSRPQLPAILPQQPPLPRIGACLAELEYTIDNQTQVGGGAPDYEDSYLEYGVEECWETCPSGWNRMQDAENRLISEPAPIGKTDM